MYTRPCSAVTVTVTATVTVTLYAYDHFIEFQFHDFNRVTRWHTAMFAPAYAALVHLSLL